MSQFAAPVVARYIRILPQSWNGSLCLRAEVLACQLPSQYHRTSLIHPVLSRTSHTAHVFLPLGFVTLGIKLFSPGTTFSKLGLGFHSQPQPQTQCTT